MGLQINCPSCGHAIRLPDRWGGNHIRCLACNSDVPIPRDRAAASIPQPTATPVSAPQALPNSASAAATEVIPAPRAPDETPMPEAATPMPPPSEALSAQETLSDRSLGPPPLAGGMAPSRSGSTRLGNREGQLELVSDDGVVASLRCLSAASGSLGSLVFEQALGNGAFRRRVILDLGAIPALDSGAIAWLIRAHRLFGDAGGRLVLFGLNHAVLDMVQLMHLHTVFNVAPDENNARQMALARP